MNGLNVGITYAFLIIPIFFAIVVIVQGFIKLSRDEAEGYVALGFGSLFILLIAAAYLLFIK
jgi:hypothetical protein